VRLESVKAEVDAKIALLDLAAFADKEVRSVLALIVLIGMRPKGRRWCSVAAALATADPIFHLNRDAINRAQVGTLSGGQKRKISLACALVGAQPCAQQRPVPAQMWAGASPVLVQMWQR
jgi:hypothetical protein